jgi:hypothetical protein
MAYTGTGGLIESWDYNRLTWGANTQTYTGSINNLASVWGTGFGFYGYGQDAGAMTLVSAGNNVTATQWSTFVQRLNLCLAHQAQTTLASGSNIGITSGATIQYFSNVATAVTTVKTNANTATAQGTTTTGPAWRYQFQVAANHGATGTQFDRGIVFTSGDTARYFFNAGGQINCVMTAVNNNGTAIGTDLVSLAQSITGGFTAYKNSTNSGRTGTGGTTNVNTTSVGYRSLTTTPTQFINMSTGAGTYSTDNFIIQHYGLGATGSNGDFGYGVYFRFYPTVPADLDTFNNAIDVTINTRLDIVYPETTYLANSWGTAYPSYYTNDIFTQFNRGQTTGANSTLSQDVATPGPLGTSTPMKMAQTGNDPYTSTYSASIWSLAPAAVGQTWEITVWMKASSNTQAEGAWIVEADVNGGYLGGGGSPFPNLTTSWQKVTSTFTLVQPSVSFVQIRLDGTNAGGTGINVWWDNLTFYRKS